MLVTVYKTSQEYIICGETCGIRFNHNQLLSTATIYSGSEENILTALDEDDPQLCSILESEDVIEKLQSAYPVTLEVI